MSGLGKSLGIGNGVRDEVRSSVKVHLGVRSRVEVKSWIGVGVHLSSLVLGLDFISKV